MGVGLTLNSELFVQSERLAAFTIAGSQRYLLFSTVGLVFPFLIVSTLNPTDLRSAQMFEFGHAKLILSQLYPSVSQKALESYCFLLFACVCMVGCLYTFFVLPETKDKTLVEISNEFKAITLCGKFSEKKRMETKF